MSVGRVLSVVLLALGIAQAAKFFPFSETITGDIVHAINNLAKDLLLQVRDDGKKTEVISPVSVGTTMLLLLRASAGSTKLELLKLLRLERYSPKFALSCFGQLLHEFKIDVPSGNPVGQRQPPWQQSTVCSRPVDLDDYEYSDEIDDPNVMHLVNAFFVQTGLFNNKNFQRIAQERYHVDIKSVDFWNDPSDAQHQINSWASANTAGRIPVIAPEAPEPSTTLVAVNALYFKARWESYFLIEGTQPFAFYPQGRSGAPIMVDTMVHVGCFPYGVASDLDANIMGFPYENRTATMYVIHPNQSNRRTLHKLLQRLDSTAIDRLIERMRMRTATVRLPKLRANNFYDFKRPLQKLGLKTLFDRNASNLTTLSRGGPPNATNLSVSGMLQGVNLEINEQGTEGAAVTASMFFRSLPAVKFVVDSPYLVIIRHEITKMILFYGAVYDPSQDD